MSGWRCHFCGGGFSERLAVCPPPCGAVGGYLPDVRRAGGEMLATAANARRLSARQVVSMQFDLRACPVTDLRWAAGTFMLLWGPPGSGKSTLGVQMIGQCSPVLVVSAEEHASPALARRLLLAGMRDRRDVELLFGPVTAADLVAAAQAGAGILVDSFSATQLSPADCRSIIDAGCPLLVGLLHALKGGDSYKGDSAWGHECDVSIEVSAGHWQTRKNRYGPIESCGEVPGVAYDVPLDAPDLDPANVVPFPSREVFP